MLKDTNKLDGNVLTEKLLSVKSIHIMGAGLNTERTAHTAVGEVSERGWRVIPVHPRDAGASISGIPIRGSIEKGTDLELVVLFLAPKRAQEVVKSLMINNTEKKPLIWFQPGAESQIATNWLVDACWPFVENDCIVRFIKRNEIKITQKKLPWFRQVLDDDNSGCSIWSYHKPGEESDLPISKVEWVGDLLDLTKSSHVIPKYVRRLVKENESLEECGYRLSL